MSQKKIKNKKDVSAPTSEAAHQATPSKHENPEFDFLPEEIQKELDANPELAKQVIASIELSRQETYQSNFPHPKHLKEFCEMYPDAAKIIFEDYKAVGESRRKQESIGLQGAIDFDRRAQW